ncbi:MAG: Hsp20/alpha crystallin family protein [Gammaproteobacteria bacterium]|nr:Hsp20/alpha crystallin family protein [Gammaproteobacteria bacterium]
MENKEKKEVGAATAGGLFSFDEFDNFFTDFLSHKWPRVIDWNAPAAFDKTFPKVDVIDHEKEIEVMAALPGVKKEGLEVTITDQTINIHATAKKEAKKEKERYFRREIMQGEYQRTLALPTYEDSDQAKATFKDGLLKVIVSKTEKSQRKNIAIQ